MQDHNTAPHEWQMEVLGGIMLSRTPAYVRGRAPVLTGYGIVPRNCLPPALTSVGGCSLPDCGKGLPGTHKGRDSSGRPTRRAAGQVRRRADADVALDEPQQGLLYVVMTSVPGQSLETCRKELRNTELDSVAYQLGDLLARMHHAPLPSPAEVALTETVRGFVRVAEPGHGREDEGVPGAGLDRGLGGERGEEGPGGAEEGPDTSGRRARPAGRVTGEHGGSTCLGAAAWRSGAARASCAGAEAQRKRQRVDARSNGACAQACAREPPEPDFDSAAHGQGKPRDAAVSSASVAGGPGAGAGRTSQGLGVPTVGCALWHDDEGHAWLYNGDGTMDGARRPGTSSRVSEPGQAAEGATSPSEQPGGAAAGEEAPGSPWDPFVCFLNRRRRIVGSMLEGSGLPLRFVAPAQALLGMDARLLMPGSRGSAAADVSSGSMEGFSETGPGSAAEGRLEGRSDPCLPTWLHGDLTSENVLFQRPEYVGGIPRVGLIDFADGGHGDPLYDLVMLFLCGFRWVLLHVLALLIIFYTSYTP